jgi:hypothetical protein
MESGCLARSPTIPWVFFFFFFSIKTTTLVNLSLLEQARKTEFQPEGLMSRRD